MLTVYQKSQSLQLEKGDLNPDSDLPTTHIVLIIAIVTCP